MLIAISGFPRSGSTFLYSFIIKLLKIKKKNCLGNFDAPINGCSDNKYINNSNSITSRVSYTKNRNVKYGYYSSQYYL